MNTQHTKQDRFSTRGPSFSCISGGLTWQQVSLVGDADDKSKRNIWYLLNPNHKTNNKSNRFNWLMPNANLAALLKVNARTMREHFSSNNDYGIEHSDAPCHEIINSAARVNRARQSMWGISGVYYLLYHSGMKIDPTIRASAEPWLDTLITLYGTEETRQTIAHLKESMRASTPELPGFEEKPKNDPFDVAGKEIINRVNSLVGWLKTARDKCTALQQEVNDLKQKLQGSKSATISGHPAAHRIQGGVKHAVKIWPNTDETLNQYVARKGTPQNKADDLTRAGLLNSDQLYSLFSDLWKDPITGKLVNKSIFQEVLRQAFHLEHSTHRTPLLKSHIVRNNLALVCQVFCKKKPNPVDGNGNILETDNPAYKASAEPCVRFQTRYTAKGVEFLRKTWYIYVHKLVVG